MPSLYETRSHSLPPPYAPQVHGDFSQYQQYKYALTWKKLAHGPRIKVLQSRHSTLIDDLLDAIAPIIQDTKKHSKPTFSHTVD